MPRISTRIAQKHDLEVNWITAADKSSFVPMQGELIIYDIEVDSNGNTLDLPPGRSTPYTYERMKIGDGKTVVTNLPFVDDTKVPTFRKINGKALSADITLSAADVGAYTKSEINNIEFITVADIDTICGTIIQDTSSSASEVTF
jgi:hypothetical protein